jgi:Tfp pilus assembly protein PilF
VSSSRQSQSSAGGLPSTNDVPVSIARVLRVVHEYEQADRLQEAEEWLRPVLAAAPELPEALNLMGLLAYRQDRLSDAAGYMEQAIAHTPDETLYLRNICSVYERLGRYSEALAAGGRAIELDPYDADAYHNLSVTHYRLLQLDQSIALARRGIALDPALPGPHFALAEALLLRGDLEAGWEEYEWRYRVPTAAPLMPPTKQPQWDGAPMPDGSLLLIADQGFGDMIQFSRLIPWAMQRCRDAVLFCPGEMRRLFRHNFPQLPMFDRWEACPEFTAFCPLSGLPRLRGVRIGNVPAEPYLEAEPDCAATWRQRIARLLPAGYRRVGIVWSGRPLPANRSIDLNQLAPIAASDGIGLFSLQMGAGQTHVDRYYGPAPLISLGNQIDDFMDTAAILASMDLVITIDTAVAHLAGAMGRPVWILLPYAPDWRWLLDRDDSPWYPTARLFRLTAPGQWAPTISRVAEYLAGMD